MTAPSQRRPLQPFILTFLALLLPVAWMAMRYDRYIIDGDAVSYMDIADLIHAHHWAGAVNGYWHPLYPALLALAQAVLHPARANELGAYYTLNFFIFLAQLAAMFAFTLSLVRLRARSSSTPSLLSLDALRLLGFALIVISSQRELSMGRVRPDALLQALILAALAMLLQALAAEARSKGALYFPALMGLFFGLAYLAKSFAFVLALLSVGTLVVFQWIIQKRAAPRAVLSGFTALLVFSAVAGPYVAALSHQKHRFDFGDSGSLNYAWYVGGTEKMHLEPWMSKDFGSAQVNLIHPERQLLDPQGPQGLAVYSYKPFPLGTYPPWFDTTYFNDHIVPHMTLRGLARRDSRNLVLVFRYILNHPEPLILLALLLLAGGSLRPQLRATKFWWPAVALGLTMWVLYGMVNVEERYVTVAYLAVLLPLFAALEPRAEGEVPAGLFAGHSASAVRASASALVLLFAFLALGESARQAAQLRRDESVAGLAHGWSNPQIFGAAEALHTLGLHPGDPIACVGVNACLYDIYWARLAGLRILTEIYAPQPAHLTAQLDALPNRPEVLETVRREGAKVLVGSFDPGDMTPAHPSAAGWVRLGETNFYALPLNLPQPTTQATEAR